MAKCPYCEQSVRLKDTGRQVTDEVHKEVEGFVKKEIMYSCPHCEKVLGFAYFLGGLATGRP